MKVEKIEFEELFPTGVYANQRYRAIGTLEDGDDFTECFRQLKNKVEKTFEELNPQINWSDSYAPIAGTSMSPSTIVPIPPKESAIESHIKTINECKTLNNLKIFEKLVKNTNDDSLSNAYMKKHEELYKQNKNV